MSNKEYPDGYNKARECARRLRQYERSKASQREIIDAIIRYSEAINKTNGDS